MKGFYIYEEEFVKGTVDCLEIGYINHTFSHRFGSGTLSEEVEMDAHVLKGTKTKCSPDDTYDFETGALISLMKMCGLEKSAKAYAEIFDDTAYGDALIERDKLKEEIKRLKEKNAELLGAKGALNYIKSCSESTINSLENTRDLLISKNNELIEENEKLKSDKDKSWKNYQRNIQKKQDRINELNNIEEEYIKLREEYDNLFEEKEKLQHEYDLCLNSENALKITTQMQNKSIEKLTKAIDCYKNDLYKVSKRCTELEAKEAILNKQEETINKKEEELSVYFGGRGNGKQYKALVELFKKIPKDKVEHAYKEAYNTVVPVWQKEFLNQMYGIHKESKEKTELPRTLDINGTVYRKSIQIKDFGEQINKLTVDSLIEQSRAFTKKCVDEWLYKIPTKREEMWEKIFTLHKESDVIIKVKKEDVITFLHEIENKIPEITWASCVKIFETKYTIKDIFKELEGCDTPYEICFRLWKVNKLSYSSDQYIYPSYKFKHIDYLPPMRWDLFKKGRLAVKVNYGNYKEFYESCERELGKKPSTVYPEEYTVSICKKDGLFEIFTIEDQKSTGRKIVDWEDVR